MKKRLVVANWKMYLESPEEAKKYTTLLRKKSRLFRGVDVVIAAPSVLVPTVALALKGSSLGVGAQSASPYSDRAHTGEVSAHMLKNAGVQFVLVGHSERREMLGGKGESNEIIHAQLECVLDAGLHAILCIGERERDQGGSHFSVITEQLSSALKNLINGKSGLPKNAARKLVIAYEPVWAIEKSAGDAMKPAELREMSIFIRKTLAELCDRTAAMRVPILYGGSVEGENAHVLVTDGDVSGFLVGHASATVDSFVEVLKAVRYTHGTHVR